MLFTKRRIMHTNLNNVTLLLQLTLQNVQVPNPIGEDLKGPICIISFFLYASFSAILPEEENEGYEGSLKSKRAIGLPWVPAVDHRFVRLLVDPSSTNFFVDNKALVVTILSVSINECSTNKLTDWLRQVD